MKTFFRYIFGGLWVLFVWFMVAVIIGIIMIYIFPSQGESSTSGFGLVWRQPNQIDALVGIGLGWRNLPGTILGLLAAWQSWRRHFKRRPTVPQQ